MCALFSSKLPLTLRACMGIHRIIIFFLWIKKQKKKLVATRNGSSAIFFLCQSWFVRLVNLGRVIDAHRHHHCCIICLFFIWLSSHPKIKKVFRVNWHTCGIFKKIISIFFLLLFFGAHTKHKNIYGDTLLTCVCTIFLDDLLPLHFVMCRVLKKCPFEVSPDDFILDSDKKYVSSFNGSLYYFFSLEEVHTHCTS